MLRKSSIHSARGKYQGHNTIPKGIEKGCHNKRSTKAAQQQQKNASFKALALQQKKKKTTKEHKLNWNNARVFTVLMRQLNVLPLQLAPFPPASADSPTELITKLVQSRACFLDFGCCCTEIFFICMEIESASKRTYKKNTLHTLRRLLFRFLNFQSCFPIPALVYSQSAGLVLISAQDFA